VKQPLWVRTILTTARNYQSAEKKADSPPKTEQKKDAKEKKPPQVAINEWRLEEKRKKERKRDVMIIGF
jgi:hypothetical protein